MAAPCAVAHMVTVPPPGSVSVGISLVESDGGAERTVNCALSSCRELTHIGSDAIGAIVMNRTNFACTCSMSGEHCAQTPGIELSAVESNYL